MCGSGRRPRVLVHEYGSSPEAVLRICARPKPLGGVLGGVPGRRPLLWRSGRVSRGSLYREPGIADELSSESALRVVDLADGHVEKGSEVRGF